METRQIEGSVSVCFSLLNPNRLLASRFTPHLGSAFSTWLPQCSFLSLSDRNKDWKMNRKWQKRRSKGWTAFSCFSGEKWRIFALESRQRLKQILLSSTQTCFSVLADYNYLEIFFISRLVKDCLLHSYSLHMRLQAQLSSVMNYIKLYLVHYIPDYSKDKRYEHKC